MPDGYDRDRENCDPNERGRIFENGTYRYFRDRENGYIQQSRLHEVRNVGNVKFDKIREDPGRTFTIEDKSGRIEGKKDEKQLTVVRTLLERNEGHHHLLRSVDGETISSRAQKLIDGLTRDFPDRFTHQIISREDAREIWARGLEKEPSPQLELPGVGEQARLQKQRQREARQQAKEREERARVEREAEQARTREDNRDQAKPAVARELTDPAPKAKDVREREEAQAREMNDPGRSTVQKELLEIKREGRESQREDIAREIDITRGQEAPTRPAEPQRTREQEREIALARAIQERANARALAIENGLSREMMGILGLNSDGPPKMIDVDNARTRAEAERDRSIHQKRERSERQREGRHRGD
ncbi:hypothetical protein ACIBG0_35775 [Nocardia sp. NPDC050630]|uniref:hypothetical protein n=1 Tax=Nocardia sp. NPDC050630 TaxID=3364321 RepID=UPI0037AF5DD5